MVHLIQKIKNQDAMFLIPLVLINLVKTFDYHYWLWSSGRGFPLSPDGKWYIDYANSLLEKFSIGCHLNDILYIGYNMLLTMLLAVFHSTVPIVLLQGLVASLGVILVYKIALMLFNRTTAVIAGVFYYNSWEITVMSTYILTDTFFNALLLLCVFLLLKAQETKDRRWGCFFLATLFYTALFRPTGMVVVATILVYILLQVNTERLWGLLKQYRVFLGGVLLLVVAAAVLLFLRDTFDPLFKSLQENAKMVLYNVYAKGWIFDKSTALDYPFKPNYKIDVWNSLIVSFLVNNWDSVAIIYFRRMIAFLGGWVLFIDFQSLQGILYFLWRLIPVSLFLAGTAAAIRNGLFRRASVLWLITGGVFVFCVLLFVDAFYRYRLPAIPYISIVAAYGADRVIQRVWPALNKRMGMLGNGRENSDCRSGV